MNQTAMIINKYHTYPTLIGYATKHGYPNAAVDMNNKDERPKLENGMTVNLLYTDNPFEIGKQLCIIETEDRHQYIIERSCIKVLSDFLPENAAERYQWYDALTQMVHWIEDNDPTKKIKTKTIDIVIEKNGDAITSITSSNNTIVNAYICEHDVYEEDATHELNSEPVAIYHEISNVNDINVATIVDCYHNAYDKFKIKTGDGNACIYIAEPAMLYDLLNETICLIGEYESLETKDILQNEKNVKLIRLPKDQHQISLITGNNPSLNTDAYLKAFIHNALINACNDIKIL